MPSRVIAIVFAHNGDSVYDTEATSTSKRVLRNVNNSLFEDTGNKVYTKFGDPRAKDAYGNPVPGYALCMDVHKDDVDWCLRRFWGTSQEYWNEVIPGVGYMERSKGRVPFLELDTSDPDAAASICANHFGIGYTPKPSATERTPKEKAPADPFGTTLDLLKLLQVSDPGFDVVSNLNTPRETLIEMYTATLTPDPEPEAPAEPEAETTEPEVTDFTAMTKKELKVHLKEVGTEFDTSANKATLVELASAS